MNEQNEAQTPATPSGQRRFLAGDTLTLSNMKGTAKWNAACLTNSYRSQSSSALCVTKISINNDLLIGYLLHWNDVEEFTFSHSPQEDDGFDVKVVSSGIVSGPQFVSLCDFKRYAKALVHKYPGTGIEREVILDLIRIVCHETGWLADEVADYALDVETDKETDRLIAKIIKLRNAGPIRRTRY